MSSQPPSKPKRHHFVPQAYLERFGRDRRVAVRRRGGSKIFVADVKNVALETGFYETQGVGGDRSVEVEEWLATVDDDGNKIIMAVIETGEPAPIGTLARNNLAVFMAVQMSRTPEARERLLFPHTLAKYAAGNEVDHAVMRRYLTEVHLGFEPEDSEVQGALDFFHGTRQMGEFLTKDDAVKFSFSTVEPAAMRLLQKNWTLEVARKPRFLTSDAPLVLWRKPTVRDFFEGIGIENAEEIRFPLDSAHQLVLRNDFRPAMGPVEPARVRQCNADLASGCHNFIVGHPDRPKQMTEIPLSTKRPVLRFGSGPGYRATPGGGDEYMGEVIHTWIQRHDRPQPAGRDRRRR